MAMDIAVYWRGIRRLRRGFCPALRARMIVVLDRLPCRRLSGFAFLFLDECPHALVDLFLFIFRRNRCGF